MRVHCLIAGGLVMVVLRSGLEMRDGKWCQNNKVQYDWRKLVYSLVTAEWRSFCVF